MTNFTNRKLILLVKTLVFLHILILTFRGLDSSMFDFVREILKHQVAFASFSNQSRQNSHSGLHVPSSEKH